MRGRWKRRIATTADSIVARQRGRTEVARRLADTGIGIEPQSSGTLHRQGYLEHAQEEGAASRGIQRHVQVGHALAQHISGSSVRMASVVTSARTTVTRVTVTAVAVAATALAVIRVLAVVRVVALARALVALVGLAAVALDRLTAPIGAAAAHAIVAGVAGLAEAAGTGADVVPGMEPEAARATADKSNVAEAQEERSTLRGMVAEGVVRPADADPQVDGSRRGRGNGGYSCSGRSSRGGHGCSG